MKSPLRCGLVQADQVVKVQGLPRAVLDTMTVMWYERRTRRYLFTAERRSV